MEIKWDTNELVVYDHFCRVIELCADDDGQKKEQQMDSERQHNINRGTQKRSREMHEREQTRAKRQEQFYGIVMMEKRFQHNIHTHQLGGFGIGTSSQERNKEMCCAWDGADAIRETYVIKKSKADYILVGVARDPWRLPFVKERER